MRIVVWCAFPIEASKRQKCGHKSYVPALFYSDRLYLSAVYCGYCVWCVHASYTNTIKLPSKQTTIHGCVFYGFFYNFIASQSLVFHALCSWLVARNKTIYRFWLFIYLFGYLSLQLSFFLIRFFGFNFIRKIYIRRDPHPYTSNVHKPRALCPFGEIDRKFA